MDEKCNPRRSLAEHQEKLIQLEDSQYKPIQAWYCPVCERITKPTKVESGYPSR